MMNGIRSLLVALAVVASSAAQAQNTPNFGGAMVPNGGGGSSGGAITCAQLPALTGDITTSAGSCATAMASTISGAKTFSTSVAIGAGSAITSSGPGGALTASAYAAYTGPYLPLAGGTMTGGIGFSVTNTLDIGTSATVLAPRTVYAGTSFVGPIGTFTTSVAVGGAIIGSNVVAGIGQFASYGASGAGPGFYAYLTGDTVGRVAIGLDTSDVPRLSMGPGGASARDTFWTRTAAATWQSGQSDAAAPVAQNWKAQSVVAGTSNTAGVNLTVDASVGTGTGTGGSIIFRTAVAGSTGSTQNTLANTLTIAPAAVSVNSASFGLSGNISRTAWLTSGVRYVNVAATLTDTTSSGTVAAAYTDVWGGNTIAASSATTFTDYYTHFVSAPTAGTNVIFTRSWALGLSGNMSVSGSVGIGGALPGSNALAVTGTAIFNGSTAVGSVTINSTTGTSNLQNTLNLSAAGTRKWAIGNDYNANGGDNFFIYSQVASAAKVVVNVGSVVVGSGTFYGITNNADAAGSADVSLSRNAAGILQVGTTAANASGSITAISFYTNSGSNVPAAIGWDAASQFKTIATGQYTWGGSSTTINGASVQTILSSPGAATVQLGAADVASSAVAQTLKFQGNTGSATTGPLATIQGAGAGSSTSVGGELRLVGGLTSAAAGTGGAVTIYTAPAAAGNVGVLVATFAADKSAAFTGSTSVATSSIIGGTIAQLFSGSQLDVIDSANSAGGQFSVRGYNATAGNSSVMVFVRGRGTLASPTAVSNGDTVGLFQANAVNQTGGATSAIASISFIVDGTYTAASRPPGKIVFQTGISNGAMASVLTMDSSQLSTFAGQVRITNIGADTALTDTTVCQDTTNHQLYAGTGTAGICLGNVSSGLMKRDWQDLSGSLNQVMALRPGTYRYKDGVVDGGARVQYGFKAEEYAQVLPVLTRFDKDGVANGTDMMGLVPVLVRAVQEQQGAIERLRSDNDNLRAEMKRAANQ